MTNSHTSDFRAAEFFMSANGGDGFRTYQSEILDSGTLDSLYILKGGPGTGKSTFMKKLLDRALDSGADVRIFKCSSDPDSIDALYITSAAGRFAITDGTAPHERNAEIPGAVDHIIDLGAFWNADLLASEKEEITRLNRAKKESYRMGYLYLSAAKKTQEILCDIYEKSLLGDKLHKSAASFLRNISSLGDPISSRLLLSAYSMSGYRRLNTDVAQAKTLISISGSDEECSSYLSEAVAILERRTQCIRIERPLCPEMHEGIILPLHSIAFVQEKNVPQSESHKVVKKINARRFFDACSLKGEARRIKELRAMLKSQTEFALEHFAEAGRFHFKLETIYRSAMNFGRENEFSDVFCAHIADKLPRESIKQKD